MYPASGTVSSIFCSPSKLFFRGAGGVNSRELDNGGAPMSGDVREMLALLVPGAIDPGAVGGRSDARQMLMGALARVRPTWAGELLLARYADDLGALRKVSYALISELAGLVWPERNPPGTLRGVVSMVLGEYMYPPPCLSCGGTSSAWRMVDGAVASADCPTCQGRGRRQMSADELSSISGLPHDAWSPRYEHLRRMLRAHERAALATMRAAMGDAEL